MRRPPLRHFFAGLAICAAVLFAGLSLDVRRREPSKDPWKTGQIRGSRLSAILGGGAFASSCEGGLVRREHFASGLDPAAGNDCYDWASEGELWVEGTGTVETFCDGSVAIAPPSGGFCNTEVGCFIPPSTTVHWLGYPCQSNQSGNCCWAAPSPIDPDVECETLCVPPKPPCCKDGDCSDCVIKPLSLPGAELAYTLPVFSTNGGGFRSEFAIFWRGRSVARLSPTGPVLGPRASHPLAFFFLKGQDTMGASHAHVATEQGDVAAFVWDDGLDVWKPEEGRRSSLVADPLGSCSGEAVFTEDDGTILRFNEYCAGSAVTEGTIISVGAGHGLTRPNGDYIDFTLNSYGQIETATNRIGETITFGYDGATRPGTESWGRIHTITSPSGDVFTTRFAGAGVLSGIDGPDGRIWTLESDPGNAALLSVRDANGALDHQWTYDSGSYGTIIESEAGPDLDPTSGEDVAGNTITIASSGGQVTLEFYPSGASTPVTNAYTISVLDGALSHVTNRSLSGDCPNCGGSNETRRFWEDPVTSLDTNLVRAVSGGNGFITVFEDLTDAGDLSSAYTSKGSPLVVNEGCTGTVSSPSCSSARRLTYSYVTGTRIVSGSTTPSVAGGSNVVTTTRSFDGSSTRPTTESIAGVTADALDGNPNDSKTRTTKRTYGEGAGSVEIATLEGPYYGTGSPPSDSPRTDYDWYDTTTDACSGSAHADNLNRLKTVTRYIDSTRTLVTKYCDYDAGGRARKIKAPTDVITRYEFNWRGQATKIVEDDGGDNLTDFTFDGVGNLTEIKRPRTTSNGRTGLKYVYDDADRVTEVQQGYYSGSSFTSLQKMRYEYDAWGNRTKTEWVSATGSVEKSEGAAYDAFNRLVCLARPHQGTGNDCEDAASKTQYGYDAEGHLTLVRDAQEDDVRYGTASDLTKYDAFGRVGRVQQEICNHAYTSPNGICSSPATANVDYSYDPALNLSQVTVNDSVRGGQIVTSYVTDDFGSVVKVVSPDSGTSYYRYDGAGRLFQSQDARGKKFEYAYDRLSRLVTKTNITGSAVVEVRYCYDDYDSACGFSNGSNANHLGKLSAVDDKAGKIEFAYDKLGRQTSEARTMNSSAVFTTSTAFDENGNRTTVTNPNGLQITRTFDETDRETEIRVPSPGPIVAQSIAWRSFGPPKAWIPKSGWSVNRVFNTAGQITDVQLWQGTFQVSSVPYSYLNDGNVDQVSGSTQMEHDSLSRLRVDRKSGGTQTYGFDDAGNRVSHDSWSYTFNAATNDRLASAEGKNFGFDSAGNVTSRVTGVTSITVADDGTVTAIQTASGTTNYTRDYRNVRIEKSGAGGAGTFLHALEGDLIQWTGPSTVSSCGLGISKTVVPHENYVYLQGVRVGMVKSHTQTGTGCSGNGFFIDASYWYFADKMDLPRKVYRVSDGLKMWDADFDSFANPIGLINENPAGGGMFTNSFRLPGQFALTIAEGGPTTGRAGLHENWNRVYDSMIGRYLQADPSGILPGGPAPAAPYGLAGGMNQSYAYAAVEPLNFTDPTGARPRSLPPIAGFDWAHRLPCAAQAYFAYRDMQRALNNPSDGYPWYPGKDRYQHCLVNCQSSSYGPCGRATGVAGSWWREATGKGTPALNWLNDHLSAPLGLGDPVGPVPEDTIRDFEANKAGRDLGSKCKTPDCADRCREAYGPPPRRPH